MWLILEFKEFRSPAKAGDFFMLLSASIIM